MDLQSTLPEYCRRWMFSSCASFFSIPVSSFLENIFTKTQTRAAQSADVYKKAWIELLTFAIRRRSWSDIGWTCWCRTLKNEYQLFSLGLNWLRYLWSEDLTNLANPTNKKSLILYTYVSKHCPPPPSGAKMGDHWAKLTNAHCNTSY